MTNSGPQVAFSEDKWPFNSGSFTQRQSETFRNGGLKGAD